jgi:phosphoribosylaminoimidazole (AIR) synthetase
MYRIFNMGIGIVAVIAPEDLPALQARIPEETFVIGELTPGEKKVVLA